MSRAKFKRAFQRRAQSHCFERPRGGEQRDVGKVFDASIGARTWHRVCMQLLGDVGLNRIQPHHRRCNTGELEHIIGGDGFRLPKYGIAECDINAECLAV